MMKSMTGYGKVSECLNGKNFEIEIRSLNGKTLDVSTKLPSNYKDKELDVRSLIASRLERGKVDFLMSYTIEDPAQEALKINETLLDAYYNKVLTLTQKYGFQADNNLIFTSLLRMPDIQRLEAEKVSEEEWSEIEKLINQAIDNLDGFRVQEGQNLKKDFQKRIDLILGYLDEVEPLEKNRINIIRERIIQKFEDLKSTIDFDKNRLEQELIYYIEKLDITEEKVRLRNHCAYFVENIDSEASSGKKLGFIAQEMGREINTLGSKANDAEIQRLVVMMKDELEKIKEQVLNIL
ncbi:MAG: YicC family protein [Bacteroidales bacterium]|nr:YicC family protein [Bacteroidales bacterium]